MFIRFEKLRWRNFLSTGNTFTEIDLIAQPMTLIVGENGAGKSTMLDALCFALFGKPYRKINKNQIVNSINRKDCVVECEFSIANVAYKIIRGIKPNVFEIYKDGALISQEANVRDYQEVLEESILQMNMKTFNQVVILGSALFVPFMQLTTPDRRAVIEDLLDLEVFSGMRDLLKERISSNTKSLQFQIQKIEGAEGRLDLHLRHLENLKQSLSDDVDTRRGKIAKNQSRIEELRNEIADLSTQISDADERRAKRSALIERDQNIRLLHGKAQSRIRERVNDLMHLESDVCKTCHQSISEEFKEQARKSYEAEVAKLQNALQELKKKLTDTQAALDEANELVEEVGIIEGKIRFAERTIETLQENNQEIEAEIASLEEKRLTYDTADAMRMELEDELKTALGRKDELEEEKEVLAMAASLLKDDGIKAQIIKQYVAIINERINSYLNAMELFVQFELDENFNETIRSRYRDEFSYASFSEGEKARIDLAILFTWRDVARLRNSSACNLLILDEVFDGSLNKEGQHALMLILKHDFDDNTNVFCITHQPDEKIDRFHRVLKFAKHNNFSTIGAA